MAEIDHEYTNEVVCPYCGYVENDSWECDDDGEMECGSCEKPFDMTRHKSVSYSTFKKEETNHA
jgi:hypothetical protein